MSDVIVKVSTTEKSTLPVNAKVSTQPFIPSGGKEGEVLSKKSNKDFDVEWREAGQGVGGNINEETVKNLIKQETTNLQPKVDESLPTESKEIVGAIKELYDREDKQGLTQEQVEDTCREIVDEETANLTSVKVNGEVVSEFDADTKVTKSTSMYRVIYGRESGEERLITYTETPVSWTLVYRNATGIATIQTPPESVWAGIANVQYVKNKITPLQSQLDIHDQIIAQSNLTYTQDIEQEYETRTTANGENVLDGSTAVLKKVVGNTVKCKNLLDLRDRVSATGSAYPDGQIDMSGKKVFVGSASSGYANVGAGGWYTLENGVLEYGTTSTNQSHAAYGIGFNMPCGVAGEKFIVSCKNENNTTVTITCSGYKDGKFVKTVNPVSGSTNTARVFTFPTDCDQILVIFPFNTLNVTHRISNIQVELGSTATDYMPYFEGLKSASFQGIESKNADGTITSTLSLPAPIECGLGTTIDFENQKVVEYGKVLEFDSKTFMADASVGSVITENKNDFVMGTKYAVCSDAEIVSSISEYGIIMGGGNTRICWSKIFITLGYDKDWVDPAKPTNEEVQSAFAKFKAWLDERKASGNPVTVRYISTNLQSETPFTTEQINAGNSYQAYKNGTETVIGNENSEVVENTLTQNYLLVKEVN